MKLVLVLLLVWGTAVYVAEKVKEKKARRKRLNQKRKARKIIYDANAAQLDEVLWTLERLGVER